MIRDSEQGKKSRRFEISEILHLSMGPEKIRYHSIFFGQIWTAGPKGPQRAHEADSRCTAQKTPSKSPPETLNPLNFPRIDLAHSAYPPAPLQAAAAGGPNTSGNRAEAGRAAPTAGEAGLQGPCGAVRRSSSLEVGAAALLPRQRKEQRSKLERKMQFGGRYAETREIGVQRTEILKGEILML